MNRTIWERLLSLLIGRRLTASLDRNVKAADDLDAAVKEMLKR